MKIGGVWNKACHVKCTFYTNTNKNGCEVSRLLDEFSALMSVITDNLHAMSFYRTKPFVRVIEVISL